jgi:hypothetical protein
MLQGVEAQRGDRRGFRGVINAKHPALEAGLVVVRISQVVGVLGDRGRQRDFSTASSSP